MAGEGKRTYIVPLIPAKAGTQEFYRWARWSEEKAWVPAFAGMSGTDGDRDRRPLFGENPDAGGQYAESRPAGASGRQRRAGRQAVRLEDCRRRRDGRDPR